MTDFLKFSPLVWFALLTLAVFRASWMLTREEGPFGVFGTLRQVIGKRAADQVTGSWWTLAELFNCPLCLGVWISALGIILILLPGIVAKLIILWLAVAGLQSFLSLLVIKDE